MSVLSEKVLILIGNLLVQQQTTLLMLLAKDEGVTSDSLELLKPERRQEHVLALHTSLSLAVDRLSQCAGLAAASALTEAQVAGMLSGGFALSNMFAAAMGEDSPSEPEPSQTDTDTSANEPDEANKDADDDDDDDEGGGTPPVAPDGSLLQ